MISIAQMMETHQMRGWVVWRGPSRFGIGAMEVVVVVVMVMVMRERALGREVLIFRC